MANNNLDDQIRDALGDFKAEFDANSWGMLSKKMAADPDLADTTDLADTFDQTVKTKINSNISPMTPRKLCNQSLTESPKAPPQGKSELEAMNPKKIEEKSKTKNQVPKNPYRVASGFRWTLSIPSIVNTKTKIKEDTPKPQ